MRPIDLINFEGKQLRHDIGLRLFRSSRKIVRLALMAIKMTRRKPTYGTALGTAISDQRSFNDVLDDMQSTEPEVLDADMQVTQRYLTLLVMICTQRLVALMMESGVLLWVMPLSFR